MRRRHVVLGAVGGLLLTRPAAAEDVDLLLVLAVDTSGSVNQERFDLQRQGYAEAFRNPRLVQAIRSTLSGSIAACLMQWTGPVLQIDAVPWRRIHDAASAEAFAAAIAEAPRHLYGGGTSVSGAITHAAELIAGAPFAAQRRVIDVSGDGANNRGIPAAEARDAALSAGITINGMPIISLEPDLASYYRDNVIGGPGGFLIVAEDYRQFGAAILRKLIREIS